PWSGSGPGGDLVGRATVTEPNRAERGPDSGRKIPRRSLLVAGGLGLAGLNLTDLLRARAQAAVTGRPSPRELSVILVWLDGGPPQHETYDPKPAAPAEIRGPLGAIRTKVPGTLLSELLPRHATVM